MSCAPGVSSETGDCWSDDYKAKVKEDREGLKLLYPDIEETSHGVLTSPSTGVTFKVKNPSRPKYRYGRNKEKWLTNVDINEVMKQYESLFEGSFRYISTVPANIQDSYDTIDEFKQSFHIGDLQYYMYNAMIINLSLIDTPGTHWVCVFVDRPSQTFEYYDPIGKPIPRTMRPLLNYINPDRFRVITSKEKHQKTGSQCGVYCMYYIVARLCNIPIKTIWKDLAMTNSAMTRKRDFFFALHKT